jgi:acetyltransferase
MAARALAAMDSYRRLRSRERGEPAQFPDMDTALAREILEEARQSGATWLSAAGCYRLLEACRIPVAGWRIVASADEAVAAAAEVGFPVVVKADSPTIIHKTEVAGVAVALENAEAVGSAVERMQSGLPPEELSFLIQEYVTGGREIIAGAALEAGLGHLIMVGLGGIHAELLKDVSFALAPIAGGETEEMLTTLRTYPLLEDFRGEPGVDRGALIEILQRLSRLVTEVAGIRELDLNPIIARPDRVCVVDVRVGI